MKDCHCDERYYLKFSHFFPVYNLVEERWMMTVDKMVYHVISDLAKASVGEVIPSGFILNI